jgi:hypothetical protein
VRLKIEQERFEEFLVQQVTRVVSVSVGIDVETKKSPLPGGQARRNELLVSWGPIVIAAPLAGSLLAPLRCAGPCQFRCRATWPTAFAPCVRSRCLSLAGRRQSAANNVPAGVEVFSSERDMLVRIAARDLDWLDEFIWSREKKARPPKQA